MPLTRHWLKLGHHLQVFDKLPLRGLFGRLAALTVLEEVVQVLILDKFEQK